MAEPRRRAERTPRRLLKTVTEKPDGRYLILYATNPPDAAGQASLPERRRKERA